jgi:hypothetical protein
MNGRDYIKFRAKVKKKKLLLPEKDVIGCLKTMP